MMSGGGDDGDDDDDVCAGVSALVACFCFWKMVQPKTAKMSKDEEHNLAVNGMAWRVKYRKQDGEGNAHIHIIKYGAWRPA